MAILKVARMGHPILRTPARRLSDAEIRSSEMSRLVQDLRETMDEYGGIGLAAPQVHQSVAVALIGYPEDAEPEPLFNPTITVLDPALQGFWEGCLSVPGLRGLVFRPRSIRIDYQDVRARKQSIEVSGFAATVYQHELDHLAGVLYVDRIRPVDGDGGLALAFEDEYQRYLIPHAESGIGELSDN